MKSLSPLARKLIQNHLAGEFVAKLGARLRIVRRRLNQPDLLGLVQAVKQRFRRRPTGGLQQLPIEGPPNYCGYREDLVGGSAQPPYSSPHHQAYIRGHLDLSNLQFPFELASRVVESIFLGKMTEQLLNKKRITIGAD